jgi:hypothetical protein
MLHKITKEVKHATTAKQIFQKKMQKKRITPKKNIVQQQEHQQL